MSTVEYSDVFVYTEANLHGSCAFVWVYPPALSTDATVPRNASWEFKINAVLLDTNDLGEAEALLSASYSKTHFRVASNLPTRTQVARSTLGPLAFDELRYNYVFGYESDPADGVVLCRVKSGSLLFQQPGGELEVCRPGMAAVVAACQGVPFSGEVHTGNLVAVLLDGSLLNAVAASASRRGAEEAVKLTAGMPMSSTVNDHMVKTIDHVMRDVATNPAAAQSPLVAGSVAQYLAASMLGCFPNTALLEPTIEDRHDSTPVLLRRAISFIDDNAANDISLVDIAQAVYISPRALQYMFRKHRDCTPTEYLRRARLHHAHLDLVAGNRRDTTVGQVAARWGFGHLGRFAIAYRQQYGESAHQTLRR